MRKITTSDILTRKKKRLRALIGSGILVLIIFPLICILISLLIDNLLNLPKLINPPYNYIPSIMIFAIGLFWAIWSNVAIYKLGEGSPVPGNDTQTIKLVKNGPYKYTRNPMIFGYSLMWYGLGLFINSWFLTIVISTMILVLLLIVVKLWEEKNLEKRFGEDYLIYKKETSFVIPFFKHSIKH
ncbi:MAG: methyltransferase family protein [Candidatus Odinarchaeota archaeon]